MMDSEISNDIIKTAFVECIHHETETDCTIERKCYNDKMHYTRGEEMCPLEPLRVVHVVSLLLNFITEVLLR